MAQAKLNNFFTSKKRTDSPQAAKRRKIEINSSDTGFIKPDAALAECGGDKNSGLCVSAESKSTRDAGVVSTIQETSSYQPDIACKASHRSTDSLSLASVRRSGRSRNDKRPSSSISAGNRGKSKSTPVKCGIKGQTKLTDHLLLKPAPRLTASSNNNDDSQPKSSPDTDLADSSKDLQLAVSIEEKVVVAEEITSVWDDHRANDGSTPRKRIISQVEIVSEGTHLPRRKMTIRKQNPGQSQPPAISESAKKKLILPPSPLKAGSTKDDDDDGVDDNDSEVSAVLTGKSQLLALVSEIIVPLDSAVSPLPATPERAQEVSSSPELVVAPTPKLQNLSEKLKVLSKMNGQALRNRLKQSGKLAELKDRLGELDTAIKDQKSGTVTVATPARVDAQTEAPENILPAYQRFENLVEEGPPLLALPFTYKMLEHSFQAMDTVVSMMHNRSEMCTFSKLKVAVQNMTKKNFEEMTVAQIKTIVPDAYIFRQENNIPTVGKKPSGYQLTIEANLKEDTRSNEGPQATMQDDKPMFTASALLRRKLRFKNNLLSYLKQIHKEFLASLKYPLSVPDDKLTRWHPRFQLDKVPAVTSAPLPQPPEVKVYHSAKDVLEKQRGRLNPRVEEALSKIVAEKEDNKKENNSQGSSASLTPSSSSSLSSLPSSPSSMTSGSLKGIPPALLAKIRAKEAQKMEAALTRSPAEDNKTRIMSHLPEVIRILRTYFVTEKKPAVPLEAAYKKLEESYHTRISQREIEQHVEMLKDLAPELISIVEIKRGKFLKLDKNVDIQGISNRILNLVKSRQ